MAIKFSKIPEWESRKVGTEINRLVREVFYRKILDKKHGDDWSLIDEVVEKRHLRREDVLAVVRISCAPFSIEETCVLLNDDKGRSGLKKAIRCMEKMRTLTESTLSFTDCYPWKQPIDGKLVSLLPDILTAKALVNEVQAINVARQKLVWVIDYRNQDEQEEVLAQFLCGTGLLGEEVNVMFDNLQAEHCARVAELEADLGNEGLCRGLLEQIPKRWKGGRELFQLLADNDEETAFCRLLDLGWSRYMIGALLGKIALNELRPASVLDRCELFAEKAKRSETRKRHEQAREAEKEQRKREKTK